MILISIILLAKELANIFIQFGQKFYAEKIRINVSSELAQAAIDKILTYRIAYYNAFDEYYVKHNLSAMEKLFAGYVNERLDTYLKMLKSN